jgi:hypothetical protein
MHVVSSFKKIPSEVHFRLDVSEMGTTPVALKPSTGIAKQSVAPHPIRELRSEGWGEVWKVAQASAIQRELRRQPHPAHSKVQSSSSRLARTKPFSRQSHHFGMPLPNRFGSEAVANHVDSQRRRDASAAHLTDQPRFAQSMAGLRSLTCAQASVCQSRARHPRCPPS